jgi:hypothetical protein
MFPVLEQTFGLGRAATETLYTGIVQRWIAVHRHQVSAGFVLRDVALRPDEAAAIVDTAVPDPEQAHVPVSGQSRTSTSARSGT